LHCFHEDDDVGSQSKVDACWVEKCLIERNEASLPLSAVALVWFANCGRPSLSPNAKPTTPNAERQTVAATVQSKVDGCRVEKWLTVSCDTMATGFVVAADQQLPGDFPVQANLGA